MGNWLWIVLIVLAVLALLVVLARRTALSGVDPTSITMTPELAAELKELTRSGQQVLAIKKLREQTGVSLAAAKVITDRMARQGRDPATGQNP